MPKRSCQDDPSQTDPGGRKHHRNEAGEQHRSAVITLLPLGADDTDRRTPYGMRLCPSFVQRVDE